jgi:S-adenosylmethionine decarboxylase
MQSAGRHLIIDGYVKDAAVFTSEKLTLLFQDLARALDMQIIQGPTFLEVELDPSKLDTAVFQDEGGITGSCIISTSHMALHAWPLRGFFSMDVFSCKSFDTSQAMAVIHESLGLASTNILSIDRVKPPKP